MQATVSILFKNFDLCIQFTFFEFLKVILMPLHGQKTYAFFAIDGKFKLLQINVIFQDLDLSLQMRFS